MPNTELTVANLKKRIESRLGGRGVKVELEQDDYVEAGKSALDFYNQRRPFKRHRALTSTTGQHRYALDPLLHPGLAGVTYCEFLTRRGMPAIVDPFDPYYAETLYKGGSGEGIGVLGSQLSYAEDSARVVNSEPEWHGDWEGAEYVLYIDIVRTGILASYEWSGYYSFDADANTGMQLIPTGDVDWFIRYATACAKEMLGRVRGKFQGITNPDGSQDPVDYQELLTEAQTEKERLEEELNKRRPPLAPVTE